MKIETDDWVMIGEAAKIAKIPDTIARRLAKELELSRTIFGVNVIKKADIPKLAENRRRRGNPDWIADGEIAAEAALRGVESRMKKKRKARAAKRAV